MARTLERSTLRRRRKTTNALPCNSAQIDFGSVRLNCFERLSAPRFPNVKDSSCLFTTTTLSPLINPQPQLASLLLERSLHSFSGRDHVVQERTAAFEPHGRCYFGLW